MKAGPGCWLSQHTDKPLDCGRFPRLEDWAANRWLSDRRVADSSGAAYWKIYSQVEAQESTVGSTSICLVNSEPEAVSMCWHKDPESLISGSVLQYGRPDSAQDPVTQ